MSSRRALHFVLKIGDRPAMIDFLKNTLGMKILRHEEFEEGCEATCNGPYQVNLLKGIDKKTSRREGISICLLTYFLSLITHFLCKYKETKWFQIAVFFISNFFQ